MFMYSSSEIAKNYINVGIKKVNLPFIKMFILAIYAGMYIASGGICSEVCGYRMTGGDGYKRVGFPYRINASFMCRS